MPLPIVKQQRQCVKLLGTKYFWERSQDSYTGVLQSLALLRATVFFYKKVGGRGRAGLIFQDRGCVGFVLGVWLEIGEAGVVGGARVWDADLGGGQVR